ncbi:MAG: DUF4282 domain-containing protein [Pseudomonadota bacterium]
MFDSWTEKLLDFDRRIGPELTRPIYYLGLIVIAGLVLGAMLMSLTSLFSDFFGSLGRLIGAPFVGVLAVLVWRLMCEWAFLYFADRTEAAEFDFEDAVDVDSVVITPEDEVPANDSAAPETPTS